MAWIKNINQGFISSCNCKNWYEHWQKNANQWLICCAEYSCTNPIYEGALVQHAEEDDETWYVVPLCRRHARHSEILDVGEVKLITAKPGNECKEGT